MTTDKLKIEYEILLNMESYTKLKIGCNTGLSIDICYTKTKKGGIHDIKTKKENICYIKTKKGNTCVIQYSSC